MRGSIYFFARSTFSCGGISTAVILTSSSTTVSASVSTSTSLVAKETDGMCVVGPLSREVVDGAVTSWTSSAMAGGSEVASGLLVPHATHSSSCCLFCTRHAPQLQELARGECSEAGVLVILELEGDPSPLAWLFGCWVTERLKTHSSNAALNCRATSGSLNRRTNVSEVCTSSAKSDGVYQVHALSLLLCGVSDMLAVR